MASGVIIITALGGLTGFDVATGLPHGTQLDVWVIAEDVMPTPNRVSVPSLVTMTTAADATPPVTTQLTTTSVEDFSFVVQVQLDEPGSFTYVVVPATSPAPSVAQVLAGTDGSDV